MFTPHNLHFWTAATSGISCVPYERLEVHEYLQVLMPSGWAGAN